MSEPSTADALLEFLRTRRSVRRYRAQQPPIDLIMRVLDVARYAPSARNSQPWVFIVVTDPKVREELAKARAPPPGRPRPLQEAPVVIVLACNRDEDPMFYRYDGALAASYVMLAAHALGLGSVWIGVGAESELEAVRRAVGLPPNYVPIALMPVGYPEEKPEPRPRKPLGEIVFFNRFGHGDSALSHP